MEKKYLSLFIFLAITIVGKGQSINLQVINSTGGTSENDEYSVEWSIGELSSVNQMNAADGSYILTNGFVQPSQASYHNPWIYVSSITPRVYPNPTTDVLQIDFLQTISGKITIELSNNAGQIVYKSEILINGNGFTEKINMKAFTKGNYTLYLQRTISGSGQYKSQPWIYKIIKL